MAEGLLEEVVQLLVIVVREVDLANLRARGVEDEELGLVVEDPLDRHVGVLIDAAGLLKKLLDLRQAVEPSRVAAHDLAREVAAGRRAGVRRGGAEPERE